MVGANDGKDARLSQKNNALSPVTVNAEKRMREKDILYLDSMRLFAAAALTDRRVQHQPPRPYFLENGVNKWIATIRPFIQVQCQTDLLCLYFISGCWFKRGREKVRTRSLFPLGHPTMFE